ncbi:adenine glycosylase [Corynebacterium atypicum]|uniref:Adenine glycosylase n=1 Tax=Corynebacterium atypicum TaxID=191610 RepID=A0ABN4DH52_9CORY|nr:A/G-specific adenine glycosylase [Corynebacterium atypicum]AIG64677.1 adenine glycosylase [Corynebacterium atypicum]
MSESFAAPARELVDWYARCGRALPWRKPGTTAWGVLVSEVMSQQTPVARVAPIWQEWMARWPTPADFAAASRAEVLRAWGNLGYPRRALRLHACAAEITQRFSGEVPSEVATLEGLPGIGTYTARAVCCFHFGQNVPVVDTNVRRVYSRLIDAAFLAGPARASDLAKVQALLPEDSGRPAAPGTKPGQVTGPEVSVALMELGALVCTAKSPRCAECPVRPYCAWVKAGRPEPSVQEAAAKRRVQKFAGTDRQVRGKIMAALRARDEPLDMSEIDLVWPDAAQRSRCLYSLIEDGLACQDEAGRVCLPD